MSDTACMKLMSSPSSAISVGSEPDGDEPPNEPPEILMNNKHNNNANNSNNGQSSNDHDDTNVTSHHIITPYTNTNVNTSIDIDIDIDVGVGRIINDISSVSSSTSSDSAAVSSSSSISLSMDSVHDDGNDVHTNLSNPVRPRRASNSSISSDDDNNSMMSNSNHGNGSVSPIASLSPISSSSLAVPTIVIGGQAARISSSTAIPSYDTYESKEMKIRYDPREVSSLSNPSIGMGMGNDVEIKDVSLSLPSTNHKRNHGEDERKETNTSHSHEFKEVERVIMREEKKAIVMLATAMLDDSHSADKQIAFNLGKLEMVADLSHTLEGLGHCVRSELVSHKNIDDVVNHIKPTELVFNLCDGTDEDGVVGVSLVNKLEEKRLAFTGACSAFYTISSAKSRMKACFEGAHVPTMPYRVVEENEEPCDALADGPMSLSGHLESLKQWPLFVKPDDAYGSMGISDACVCRNHDELMAQCNAMRKSGFKRLMVEGFLDGDEFSVLMTDVQTYPAVKKVYLREGALCLDFKADWIDNSYEMVPVNDQELDDRLRAVAQSAYTAVAGNSYARVDLRIHRSTGTICVLEVNSQPGIGDNSTAWDVLIGYASRAKLSKGHVTAQFLQDIVSHPRRGLLPLGITVDNAPHSDPE